MQLQQTTTLQTTSQILYNSVCDSKPTRMHNIELKKQLKTKLDKNNNQVNKLVNTWTYGGVRTQPHQKNRTVLYLHSV